ncbi:TetR family transcriptional regulator [Streptomyces sp. NPDC047072]|uniref:TetR/AcrR family transcriptional regulator n=1 Tax=Streptomyces sp. NPDC047072 TaxID=3154809 RepID=UPI00340EBCB4
MGRRELKKRQMRERIAETAWGMFAERGFERVTVVEVAGAAGVSEATVFNYFPSKEDLFYSRLESFWERLVEAVWVRAPGESALVAFRRQLLADGGLLARVEDGDEEALAQLRAVNRTIADSPALRARERRAFAECAEALGAVLADEDGDVVAHAAAHALLGVHRALVDHVRDRILTDDDPSRLAEDVRRLAERAFTLLERGMGEYGVRGGPA